MSAGRRIRTQARCLTPAAIALAAILAGSPPVAAQTTRVSADPALTRIDSLSRTDALREARQALEQWNLTHPRGATGVPASARVQALLLQARLAKTWPAAEEALLAIALGYPVSADAPEALLRLGQGLVASAMIAPASNAATRATGYLERAISDYPNSPLRGTTLLWLARAHVLGARIPTACARLSDALRLTLDDETRALALAEQQRNCPRAART
jgi:hypothetical protein